MLIMCTVASVYVRTCGVNLARNRISSFYIFTHTIALSLSLVLTSKVTLLSWRLLFLIISDFFFLFFQVTLRSSRTSENRKKKYFIFIFSQLYYGLLLQMNVRKYRHAILKNYCITIKIKKITDR